MGMAAGHREAEQRAAAAAQAGPQVRIRSVRSINPVRKPYCAASAKASRPASSTEPSAVVRRTQTMELVERSVGRVSVT